MAQGVKTETDPRVSWWNDAMEALAGDELIGALVEKYRSEGLARTDDLMSSMLRAVCGQQVSNAVALKQQQAVLSMAGNATGMDLAKVLAGKTAEEMRECGLSRTKGMALMNLAAGYADGFLTERALAPLSDEAILERLVELKGVGPWTAHMILIFGLNRPDVFAAGDYGIKKASETQFGSLEIAVDHAQKWAPWRTAATWLLWRTTTEKPVQY